MSRKIKVLGTERVANCRILVVDDANATRKLIINHLKDLGFRGILQAGNGLSAWKMVSSAFKKNEPFQLIISDINMPEENGLELLEKVRSKFPDKHVKFLIISSKNDSDTILDAVHLGANNFIMKPFSEETFKNKILAIISETTF